MRNKIKIRILVGVCTAIIVWLIGAFLLLDWGWLITKYHIAIDGTIINRIHFLLWVALKIFIDFLISFSYTEFKEKTIKNENKKVKKIKKTQ